MINQLLNDEVKAQLKERLDAERKVWDERIAALETKIQAVKDGTPNAEDITTKSAYESLVDRIETLQALLGRTDTQDMVTEVKSFGRQFFDSDQLKAYKDTRSKGANTAFGIKGSIWDGHPIFGAKDITSSGLTPTASVIQSQHLANVIFAGVRQLRIRDVIPTFRTTEGAVSYVKENSFTNAAYPQTEGAAKGHTDMAFVAAQQLIKTIAHYIKASKQVLSDWGQGQAAIDFKLLVGLKDREDFELLRGDGTGDHLTGLITGGTAFSGATDAADTVIDRISEMMQQLESYNHRTTAVVMNPADWRRATRVKDQASNVGNYVLGGPATMAEPRLWGVPVVLSNGVPPTWAVVMDSMTGDIALYDREESRIDVSTENEDDFIKNMVTIRAEERLALTIGRSDLIVYTTSLP